MEHSTFGTASGSAPSHGRLGFFRSLGWRISCLRKSQEVLCARGHPGIPKFLLPRSLGIFDPSLRPPGNYFLVPLRAL